MSLTILENIAVELKRRLSLMVANTTYGTNVIEVIRPSRLESFTPRDMQIVMTQGSEEIVEELSCPGNPPSIAKRQTFNVKCHVMTDEYTPDPTDTTINKFAADVMKTVMYDYSTWHTFDGNAIDAAWGSQEYINADGGVDGVSIPLYVVYRTDEDDPYNVR